MRQFFEEFDQINMVPVNFVNVMGTYQHRLGLDGDLTLESILAKFDEAGFILGTARHIGTKSP